MADRPPSVDPRPVYLRIADSLRLAYEPGKQLPSMPALAETWGVARETIRSAVEVLRSEGLVVSWRGKGTFYQARPDTDPADDPIARQLTAVLARLSSIEDRLATVEQRLERGAPDTA
ncbi:winged helix-turn-helix domain-containing protein [Nocardia sp. alder85J]|uniref:GntR family transcriptional regulator n=1 Tax=Nocardia sp. alder85J TaxID=2862949 RepID=UPI001CD3DC97|nr:winged helix-turn-helix domain-containing protein [Nocardia sp. alder85J]MCX4095069.1 winged helix-turn-helix domain-containing protein [Nocardia sp. alder85J]